VLWICLQNQYPDLLLLALVQAQLQAAMGIVQDTTQEMDSMRAVLVRCSSAIQCQAGPADQILTAARFCE
jgi:hypothetical protein